ncbi:MAG: hypothetical protein LBL66_00430 [Clostridiales bacterium]|jgi:hypothetical protein|nr:hypothetical protein [Clostridiales bacterium]
MKKLKLTLICLLCACVAAAAFACGTNPKNTDPTKPLTAEKAAEVVGGYKSPTQFDSYAMDLSLAVHAVTGGMTLDLGAALSHKYQKTANGVKAYAKVTADDGTQDFLQTTLSSMGVVENDATGPALTLITDGGEAWAEATATAGTLYLKVGDNKVYSDLPPEALVALPLLTGDMNLFGIVESVFVAQGEGEAVIPDIFNEDGSLNWDKFKTEAMADGGATEEQFNQLKALYDSAPIKADGSYDLEKLLKNFTDYTVTYDKKTKKNTIGFTISKAKVKAFALDVAKFVYAVDEEEFDADAQAETEAAMDIALTVLDCFSFEIVPGKDYFESFKVTVGKIGDFLTAMGGVADGDQELAAVAAMLGDATITLSVNFTIGGQTVDIPSVTGWPKEDFFGKKVAADPPESGFAKATRSIDIEVEDDENTAEVLAAAILDKANETYGEDFAANARIELFGYLVYSDELEDFLANAIEEGDIEPSNYYTIQFDSGSKVLILHFIWRPVVPEFAL